MYAVRRPVVNSYLVRQHDRRRRRELGVVLLACLPLAVALLGYDTRGAWDSQEFVIEVAQS